MAAQVIGETMLRQEGLPRRDRSSAAPRSNRLTQFLRFRSIVFLAIGVFLVWQVVTRSLVAYLAEVAPETALHLQPTDPTALVHLAEKQLGLKLAAVGKAEASKADTQELGAESDANAQISQLAEQALLNDPLNARALRILGQLAAEVVDEERAEKLMDAAVRRSLRQSVAVYWLMRKSYERQDYGAAIRYADTLLRTRPQVMPQVAPILTAIAEAKDSNGQVISVLADNPPWRAQFLGHLPNSISDARTPLNLLVALKDTAAPPTAADLLGYLNFLIGRKFHELAYYTWLQFLPSDQLGNAGLLFNGSFEGKPSGLPFDWVITSGSGVSINIVSHPDRDAERALFIDFGHGRVEFGGVTQVIMLPPGTYQFQGKYKGNVIGRRGLQWRIACASGASTQIGESPMLVGVAMKWKPFDFSFTVPKTDCRAQSVRLAFGARSASERFVSGSIWYDELQIRRTE
jgi:hypothetical protein